MASMTEEEYRKFKEVTGFKEPQTIRTFYKEASDHKLFLQHHAERRALNRTLRSQQCSIVDRIRFALKDSRRYDGWPEY